MAMDVASHLAFLPREGIIIIIKVVAANQSHDQHGKIEIEKYS